MRLYVIRHGRTQPAGSDSHAWPLSPVGEAQSQRLAQAPFWARVQAVYSSPEEKALATIRPAAQRYGLIVQADDRLREVRRPPFWIEDYETAVQRFFQTPENPPDGWESVHAARARMSECIEEIAAQQPDGAVAVCGHGLALALWLGAVSHTPFPPLDTWRSIGFGSVAVVEDRRLIAPFTDPEVVS